MKRKRLPGPRTTAALAAAVALLLPTTVAAHGAERTRQAPTASWSLKWSPASGAGVADSFEGAEDDRADSHPGVTHIYPSGGGFRTDIHYPKDVDTSADRQRNEVRGMRQNGAAVKILKDETGGSSTRCMCRTRWTRPPASPTSCRSRWGTSPPRCSPCRCTSTTTARRSRCAPRTTRRT
ncbi:hypothetical protein SAZ11_10345 [Streptomyces sp. FXJ1.4098]|nr:hypothetical protein [Streptomyces sp. FXJ1.4098]